MAAALVVHDRFAAQVVDVAVLNTVTVFRALAAHTVTVTTTFAVGPDTLYAAALPAEAPKLVTELYMVHVWPSVVTATQAAYSSHSAMQLASV